MKNVLLIFFVIETIGLGLEAYSQCTIKELFPVQHGMTKFQAIKQLNLQTNILEVEDKYNHWNHPKYLSGDSIYESQIYYKVSNQNCLKGNNIIGILSFADFKLYQMTLRSTFNPEEFKKCMENYNLLLQNLKFEFPFSKKFDEFYTPYNSDNQTEEQIGEGYWLYRNEEDSKKSEYNRVSIGYSINYEFAWNTLSGKYNKTGKIENYKIEIYFTNINGTKIDWSEE